MNPQFDWNNASLACLQLLQKGELSNAELRILTEELGRIRFGDNEARIKHISIRGLIPGKKFITTFWTNKISNYLINSMLSKKNYSFVS